MRLFDSKKSEALGLLLRPFHIVVGLISVAIILVFSYMIMYYFFTNFNLTAFAGTDTTNAQTSFYNAFSMFDWTIVVLVLTATLSCAVAGARFALSPIYYIVWFILIPIEGLLAWFFNYVFSNIVSESLLLPAYNALPNTVLIATNLHWIALASAILLAIAGFRKRKGGQEFATIQD